MVRQITVTTLPAWSLAAPMLTHACHTPTHVGTRLAHASFSLQRGSLLHVAPTGLGAALRRLGTLHFHCTSPVLPSLNDIRCASIPLASATCCTKTALQWAPLCFHCASFALPLLNGIRCASPSRSNKPSCTLGPLYSGHLKILYASAYCRSTI